VKRSKIVYRKPGGKRQHPSKNRETPFRRLCRRVCRPFSEESEKQTTLGGAPVSTYELAGLAGKEWTDETLLKFLCQTIYWNKHTLLKALRHVKEPLAFGEFAEAIYVGNELWKGIEEQEHVEWANIKFPRTFLNAPGLARHHSAGVLTLLELLSLALYNQRKIILAEHAKAEIKQPECCECDVAEALFIAAIILARAGYHVEQTELIQVARWAKARRLEFDLLGKGAEL
jgi:hypothetical protein